MRKIAHFFCIFFLAFVCLNYSEKDIKHDGNLTIDDVKDCARTMREADKSNARLFSGTVKEILGTCLSVGCTVEGKDPREVTKEIQDGVRVFEEDNDPDA